MMNWILVLMFLLMLVETQSQNICTNAFYTSTQNFIFNNQGCQGFSYNSTLTPNPNVNSIVCSQSIANCSYWIPSSSPQIFAYLFCNTTLPACSVCSQANPNTCVTCSQCYSGYYFNIYNTTGNCQNCLACSTNCSSCTNNNNCSNCNQGFFLNLYNSTNINYNCQPCSTGCQTCPSASNCTTCNSGYYFYVYNANQTLQSCSLCNATFPGCQSCSNNLTCTTCLPGFYPYTYNVLLSYNNCISCSSAIPGCMYCNSQTSCQQCSSEYLNINGQCYDQGGVLVSGVDPFTSGGSKTAEIIMDIFIGLILVLMIYAFWVFFVQKRFVRRQSYVSREPVRIDNTEIKQPKRFSEMKDADEMRRDSEMKERVQTRNGDQYIAEASMRDELVSNTNRGISA